MNKSTEKIGAVDPSEELQSVFLRFHQKVTAVFRKESRDVPVSLSQLEALRFINEEKSPSMKDLAAHLNIAAPSATAMIDHLVEKKLVDRKLDKTDRRTVRILPTQKTSELFSSFRELKARVFQEMIDDLSEKDQKTLIQILKKII